VERFDQLIHEQLLITEKMIQLQKEIDNSQQTLKIINDQGAKKEDLISLLMKIANDKKDFEELQYEFKRRTDEVIQCYRDDKEKQYI
jgi:putative IMPACT (imprinted ancient) family translation regulator